MNKKYLLVLGLVLTGSLLGINAYASMGDGTGPENRPRNERGMGQNKGERPMPGQGFENRRPAVIGTITKIDGTTITIDSIGFGKNVVNNEATDTTEQKTETVTYTVDASKATFYEDGAESKIEELAIGEKIMVEGTVDGTKVTATKVHEGNMGQGNRANFDQNDNANKAKSNNGFWGRIGNFFGRMFGKK